MKLIRQARDTFADIPPEERERLARLGAVLFMAGSLTAIPAGLLLEPPPKAYEHLIAAVGFVSGVVLYRLDWTRLPSSWLHVFPVLGTLLVIASMTVFSAVFSFFVVLGGMFVAISVRDASVFSAYIAFFLFALVLPLTYSDGDRSEEAVLIVATIPVLLAVAFVSRYMHEVVESQKEQYRVFASEAIALAERIRGSGDLAADESPKGLERRLRDLSEASSRDRRDWSTRQGSGAHQRDVP